MTRSLTGHGPEQRDQGVPALRSIPPRGFDELQDIEFLPKAFTSLQQETECGQNWQEGREKGVSSVARVPWPLLLALSGADTT